jgi:hypothetical protein
MVKPMDKKTYAIGVLFVTAVILLVANSFTVPTARAYSIKDRDYQLVTTAATEGGDSLFVTDNRTGMIAIFGWDPTARKIVLRDRKFLADLFGPR